MRTAGLLVLLVPAFAGAQTPAANTAGAVDLLSVSNVSPEQWERFTRRSDSPPIKLAEVKKMQDAGIGDATILEMLRTRRVVDRVNPDDLIAMKKKGASDDLIAALSAYALAENRSVELALNVDLISGGGSLRQSPFLYIEFVQTKRNEREHLLTADLRALASTGEVINDRTDPLLPNRIRRLRRIVDIPLRHPGPIEMRVLVSRKPDYLTLQNLSAEDRKRLKTYKFELPAVSLYNDCEFDLRLQRDRMIADLFMPAGERFQCYFD